MRNSQGFTLIEILIVLVIIGITLGFAVLAFGDFGEERRIIFFAEQLNNSLKLAQQQAILETSTMGLRIDNTSYQIVKFQDPAGWNYKNTKGIFKNVLFPRNTVLNIKTDNKIPNGVPAIVIDPSGDMTPFTLYFGSTHTPVIVTITGKHNGSLNLIKVPTN